MEKYGVDKKSLEDQMEKIAYTKEQKNIDKKIILYTWRKINGEIEERKERPKKEDTK